MKIRPYEEADESEVLALWRACGLVVPHNDPARDIARKLAVDRVGIVCLVIAAVLKFVRSGL